MSRNKVRSQRHRRHQDVYGRRARKEGYAARSVYKLQEVDKKVRLLRRGARVLDLGAYPGSWTTWAAEQVGREGRVLGFDLTEFTGALPPNAEIRQGDVLALDFSELGSFDVVMSDMAPSTSGHRFTDQARSFELFIRALTVATEGLEVGGNFVAKIFQGGDFPEAQKAVRKHFQQMKVIRPKSVRSESFEVYIAGIGFKGRSEGDTTTDDETTVGGFQIANGPPEIDETR